MLSLFKGAHSWARIWWFIITLA